MPSIYDFAPSPSPSIDFSTATVKKLQVENAKLEVKVAELELQLAKMTSEMLACKHRMLARQALGGSTRAKSLTPERRREVAQIAAQTRWATHKKGL